MARIGCVEADRDREYNADDETRRKEQHRYGRTALGRRSVGRRRGIVKDRAIAVEGSGGCGSIFDVSAIRPQKSMRHRGAKPAEHP